MTTTTTTTRNYFFSQAGEGEGSPAASSGFLATSSQQSYSWKLHGPSLATS